MTRLGPHEGASTRAGDARRRAAVAAVARARAAGRTPAWREELIALTLRWYDLRRRLERYAFVGALAVTAGLGIVSLLSALAPDRFLSELGDITRIRGSRIRADRDGREEDDAVMVHLAITAITSLVLVVPVALLAAKVVGGRLRRARARQPAPDGDRPGTARAGRPAAGGGRLTLPSPARPTAARSPSAAPRRTRFVLVGLLVAVATVPAIYLVGATVGRHHDPPFAGAVGLERVTVVSCTKRGPVTWQGYGYWHDCFLRGGGKRARGQRQAPPGAFGPADVGRAVTVGFRPGARGTATYEGARHRPAVRAWELSLYVLAMVAPAPVLWWVNRRIP